MWDIDLIKPRALQMRRLMQSVHRNTYGLPEGFYRVDLLIGDDIIDLEIEAPPDQPTKGGDSNAQRDKTPGAEVKTEAQAGNVKFEKEVEPTIRAGVDGKRPPLSQPLTPHQRVKAEQAAFIGLDYHDGFPVIPDGRPFWARLPWEPDIAFALFQVYLGIGQDGTRALFAVHREAVKQNIVHPWVSHSQPHLGIQLCADMFCWHDRARSFDLFELVELRKSLQRKAISTTDRHHRIASKLVDTAFKHLEKIETGEGEPLTNREAIELLKVAASLERISVGLPAAGVPGKQEQDPQVALNTPVDIMLGTELKRQGISGNARKTTNLDQFLIDPALAQQAQDMVLRLRGQKELALPSPGNKGTPGVDAEPDTATDTDTDTDSVDPESEENITRLEREIAKDVAGLKR